MRIQSRLLRLFITLLLFVTEVTGITAQAAELTARFSILGTIANATQGDAGYINKNKTLSADQQSLRLMLDDTGKDSEWSIHLKTARQHLNNFTFDDTHSSDLFRFKKLSGNWLNESNANSATRIGYELDRALYKHFFKNSTLALGRQPVDWGSGRFWQPLNVFGTFAPTDLDTDFKPGIDAARFDWFPSVSSSLSAIYAFSEIDNNSGALQYRRQIGKESELAFVAGNIISNRVLGASFESSWGGLGWRVEGLHTDFATAENSFFWIAGLDYQFTNGTLITAEWYNNSRGANSVASMINLQTDTQLEYGLQQQLSQNVLAISFSKDISPLLNGRYTLFASPLKDLNGQYNTSLLHQVNFSYSLSDESDLLFSLILANGRGLTILAKPQSEFGHVPASMTLRFRLYF